MKKSIVILFSILLIISFEIICYYLQLKIEDFNKEIIKQEKNILSTEVEIEILKTELYHLKNISTIRQLTDKYFKDYININSNSFININDIPMKDRSVN